MAVRKPQCGVAVVAVCIGMVLVGCATTSRPGATSSPTVSPTSTSDVIPTREPVAPPNSREAALAAALAVVEADDKAFFDVISGTVPHESVLAFEGGSYVEDTFGFLEALLPDPGFLGVVGEPDGWTPDCSLSSVSTLVSDGESYPYGMVHLVGCTALGWKIVSEPEGLGGRPAIGEVLPSEFTVEYDPSQRVWLITDGKSLTGQPGAPECPLASP